MPTLELKNVCYAYEKGKAVLSNINAELETGKLYAILLYPVYRMYRSKRQ